MVSTKFAGEEAGLKNEETPAGSHRTGVFGFNRFFTRYGVNRHMPAISM
jgi:hypothetical protein